MNSRKGLTLIEVILTIAIISIIVVVTLGVFNTGIINTVRSGERTDEVLEISNEIDKKIKIKEEVKDGTDEVTITIPGVLIESVKGTFLEKTHLDNPNIEIKTFVPNKIE